MPVLSTFYGITVRMHSEKGERHHFPHIHCVCGEFEAVYKIDGSLLEGSIPPNKQKLLLAWLLIHEEELKTNWKRLSEGEQILKIPPLI